MNLSENYEKCFKSVGDVRVKIHEKNTSVFASLFIFYDFFCVALQKPCNCPENVSSQKPQKNRLEKKVNAAYGNCCISVEKLWNFIRDLQAGLSRSGIILQYSTMKVFELIKKPSCLKQCFLF